MRRLLVLAVLIGLVSLSCSKSNDKKPLTERQRDSILAREPLPGASVVGRALEVSDTAAARAARIDSMP
jgi:hypothetical protein